MGVVQRRVWRGTSTHAQTDRQTDRQTEREREREQSERGGSEGEGVCQACRAGPMNGVGASEQQTQLILDCA
eukprot:412140-Rhodomonas_salina.1